LSHLEADTRYVQAEILSALRRLPHKAAVDPLVDRLGDPSPWIRSLALSALARQDSETFWLLLAGLGSDSAWEVRSALADLFASLEGDRPPRLLAEMVEDPDGRVRAAALRSLAQVSDSEETKRIAIRHLGGADPFERVAAAKILAAIGANDAFPPLEQAFLEEKDEDPRIRAALLNELYALDRVKVQPLAERALDDPSYFVRRTAVSLLASLGLERSLRPRSSERGLQEYLDIVNMPYSPTAFIDTSRGRLEVELFVADAPQTALNFIRLARAGFYAGTSFHGVVPNGHVAGGDPRGDGMGGPGYVIGSEINERPFVRGTLVLQEGEGRDSGGSRFLILHLPDPKLEGRATAFGLVTSGMEAVDRIEPGDVIEKVTIWDGVTSPYEGR
jgi:peptidyl-prolyl cis-trans isomerase B (cyclophilin B)